MFESNITAEIRDSASMSTQESRKKVEDIKTMSEQKTTLPSLSNQDPKKVNLDTEKESKVLLHIPTDNITELNE